MGSVSVHRRLVKSPPELWAEVSDPQTLAQHLGEFGEIRITRVEPETTVAWEGESARGTVEIETTGWGAKVILTAELVTGEPGGPADPDGEMSATKPTGELDAGELEPGSSESAIPCTYGWSVPEPASGEPGAAEIDPSPMPSSGAPGTAKRDLVEHDASSEHEPGDASPLEVEPDVVPSFGADAATAGAPPRRGFFAWLFRRRRPAATAPVSRMPNEPAFSAPHETATPPPTRSSPDPVAPAHDPAAKPEQTAELPSPPEPVVAPVLSPTPSVSDRRTLAILDGILDDLGAAHHRPFSRG